jgi:hypothetical protein
MGWNGRLKKEWREAGKCLGKGKEEFRESLREGEWGDGRKRQSKAEEWERRV